MPNPTQRFHLFLARAGALAGVLGMVAPLILYLTTGDSYHMWAMFWSAIFTIVPAVQLALGRPNAAAVATAGLVVMALSAMNPQATAESTRLWWVAATLTGGVIVPILSQRQRRSAFIFGIALPFLLAATRPPTERWVETIGMSVGFSIIYAAATAGVLGIIRQAHAAETKREATLRNSPIATWEQDYTAVVAHFADLRAHGISDIRAYLSAVPERVHRCIELRNPGVMSATALAVFEADTAEDFRDPERLAALGSEFHETIIEEMAAIWEGRTDVQTEIQARTLRGKRLWLQTHWSAPVSHGTPDYSSVVLAVVDLTAQKEAEAGLEAEIRAKDDFLASVSHELRTPLAAVVGIAQELAANRGTIGPDETQELIELIANEGMDVANIVEDLLAAARLEAGQLTVNAEDTDLIALAAQAGQRFEIAELDQARLKAFADPNRVRQIVRNLLSNALRYGGPVVRITGASKPGISMLEVRDNGPGIAPEDRERVFQPYQRAATTPGVAGSVGIGLSVSQNLARLMGGDLSYRHVDGESVFTLSLPSSEAGAKLAAPPAA